ncbi:MAG: NUDIX hydrolase [Chloroflexota bacterium]|nr:MAG: ADP-ribose pyrophosphatase [Chloroflexota bacterium]
MSPLQIERTQSSETVFDGRLIDVRRDTVRLPNGMTAEREIVVHPNVIGVVPELPDGRIVLVRQFRKSAERILLEIPAGGIDEGETPEQAVAREMAEETGYRVGSVESLGSFYTSPGYSTEFMYLFTATDLESGPPTEDTDEIEVVELPLADALSRLPDREMADAKTQIALLLYARRQESR